MACVDRLDYLMEDLKTIDRFFQKSNYHCSEPDLKKIQTEFQNGYAVLEQNSSQLEGNPTLLYDMVLAYGNKDIITESDKRFFIDVEIWSSLNGGYNIKVVPWHGQEKSDSKAQIIKKYFTPVKSSPNPLQEMLKDLEKVL